MIKEDIRVRTYSRKSNSKTSKLIGKVFLDEETDLILLENIDSSKKTTYYDAVDLYNRLGTVIRAAGNEVGKPVARNLFANFQKN